MWGLNLLDCVKALIPGLNFKPQEVIWDREWKVYHAMCEVLSPKENPAILNGRYSWLLSQTKGFPMQIDILYTKITSINGVSLKVPTMLAVEVQSSIHDGKWNGSKKLFFKDEKEFREYTANQAYKAKLLRKRGCPLMEIDPSKEPLDAEYLTNRVKKVLGIK
jgi:hypothetical protein